LADLSHLSGPRKLLAIVVTVLALLAFGLSSYLTWVTWQQSTVVGCTAGSMVDCDEVLASAWSKWLGIPVSLFGMLTYAAILALVWPAILMGGGAMTMLLALAMTAAGAGAWFIGMQAFVLQHFCLYCLAVHGCGLLICTVTIFLMRGAVGEVNYDHMRAFFGPQDAMPVAPMASAMYQPLIASGIASTCLSALVGGQMLFAPPSMEIVENMPLEVVEEPTSTIVENSPEVQKPQDIVEPEPVKPTDDPVALADEEAVEVTEPEKLAIVEGAANDARSSSKNTGEASRYFHFSSLARDIDAAGNPVLGNPYAPHRFVEMMDYTCPHCRKLHAFITSAVERYGNEIGFVIYHVPLSRKCNQLVKLDQASHLNACDYAKLAYGVWKIAPEKFEEYHDWLMTGKRAPALHEAKRKAMQLAGEAVLFDKSIEADSNRRVGEYAAEFEKLQVGLPVLVFEGGIIRGMPETEQQWFEMLEQRMGLRPVANVTN
jgi:uncharacterized membrane protein